MKMMFLIISGVFCIAGQPYAQTTKIIFGPRNLDTAKTACAYGAGRLDMDIWIRTAPGIRIIAFHFPLSSNDSYVRIDSLNRGELNYPLNESWETNFCPPNPDERNPGYTSRSLVGSCSYPGDCDPVQTEGQWLKIARFIMTATGDESAESLWCDAFREGFHPEHQGIKLVDYDLGELDPSTYEIEFSCLNIPFDFYFAIGDYNGSNSFNVADIVDALMDLKGQRENGFPFCYCPCGELPMWTLTMDINGSCGFNLADVVIGYTHLKTGRFELIPCEYCPPDMDYRKK